jgi:3-oxoacyl-[acyl-carrier protein] reductase
MLVTGATGGVGRELLRLARAAGWGVVGIYRQSRAMADELGRELGDPPGSLQLEACDLTDAGQVGALLERLPAEYCPDALVHLAAPPLDVRPLHRTAWDEYQRQLDAGLKAAVLLTQPLLPRMARRGAGRVIIALSAVVLGTPPKGFAAYAVAKHALAAYARSVDVEYRARGISVNTVSPGPMDTGLLRELPALMTEEILKASGGKWVDPAAVARTILWLAGEADPEISGCNVPITRHA